MRSVFLMLLSVSVVVMLTGCGSESGNNDDSVSYMTFYGSTSVYDGKGNVFHFRADNGVLSGPRGEFTNIIMVNSPWFRLYSGSSYSTIGIVEADSYGVPRLYCTDSRNNSTGFIMMFDNSNNVVCTSSGNPSYRQLQ